MSLALQEVLTQVGLYSFYFPSPDLHLDYHTEKTLKKLGSAFSKPGKSYKIQQVGKDTAAVCAA